MDAKIMDAKILKGEKVSYQGETYILIPSSIILDHPDLRACLAVNERAKFPAPAMVILIPK